MRAGDEPIVPTGRVPMLPSDNTKVDWFLQSIVFSAHMKRKPGADQVWKLKIPTGTPAQVVAFKKLHEDLNNHCYSVMVEMCLNNDTAMMQVRNLFISDPGCWANTLWVALETRFTQERVSQVQANLILLGKFSANLANETFKQMIDRFKKLIADVRAIDPTQVPSENNLLAILKESVIPITALWAQLQFNTVGINLEIAMDVISQWRVAGNSEVVSRTVANFMGDNPAWKKKAFAKQAKAGNQRKTDKFTESRDCLVCKKKGHLVKDCRDPRKAEWIRNRRKRDASPDSRGRSRDRHPRERSNERSPSRDRSQSRDRSREKDRAQDSRESRVDRSHFDKSRSKKSKSWMSADGDQIDEVNMVGAEMLKGVNVDAAFATITGPDLVCVDSGCNKIILMDVPEDQNCGEFHGRQSSLKKKSVREASQSRQSAQD